MTDVANVEWPEDMVVEDVTFKKGWTQARDEFGMGFIQFDKTGKIATVEYSKSCYGNIPTDPDAYNENIKSFTGILNMVDFAIVAIKGQLVFGLGVALPSAVDLLTVNYKTSETWERMPDHFASLKESDVGHFEAALKHYVKALNKPLTEKLIFADIVDESNPLRTKAVIDSSASRFKSEKEMEDHWVELTEEIRLFYQTGYSEVDAYCLSDVYENAPIKHRQLPVCQ